MEQHPVPQNIASYEFRLVGDMTIKQFAYLATGCLVGLVLYSSALPAFIKLPLAFGAGFLGFAFAFLPIEERPLSQWLMAFSKAIFAPTQFIWKKQIREPELFRPSTPIPAAAAKNSPIPPTDRKQLEEYLKTLPYQPAATSLDQKEADYLQRLQALGQAAPSVAPTPIIMPIKITPVRKAPVFEAKTSLQLPIPTPPDRPNILVGMVLDATNQMIEGAILEIRRSDDMPVRALKTNKLGQFQIVTPLANDTYEIEIEKEGYQFDIIKIEVKGEIISPLEIHARARAQMENVELRMMN
ncbi:hypothetical protein COT65_00125 [Candidatus Shapirobacteria bacterium CG09_land_8_20_14_0_10_47_13]|uniref:Carboxypeptidase regulatory-like domain-containing protein n=1 Tax=Candidatus Shapirobacteria bacterium CG09_land_8_20_14_0_10_47_13 TaxID=1974481 RepID=A0A2H0WNG9_9BACT|nr:MAG: hypothetical protein COT65_00125 [Candidatus Shapirobacteria bacterium CG09_land_8_20_14_0_10_47_13]